MLLLTNTEQVNCPNVNNTFYKTLQTIFGIVIVLKLITIKMLRQNNCFLSLRSTSINYH